jgi:hypothetical protein
MVRTKAAHVLVRLRSKLRFLGSPTLAQGVDCGRSRAALSPMTISPAAVVTARRNVAQRIERLLAGLEARRQPKQDSIGCATYRMVVACSNDLLGGRWLDILVLCRARINFENCRRLPVRNGETKRTARVQ